MSELPLAVGKIVRRLDKRIFSVARAAKRPYSITNRLCCKTEKAEEKTPHLKEQVRSSPFSHEVSEWDKKLLMWSGRFKKKEDIPHEISAKMMSASRSKLRVKVAYVAMAILLMGFVSAVFIGKQDVQKYRHLRYMPIEKIVETDESTSTKP
ncbi:PREDICTED: protein FAM162A [Thamnophis sirtalis]|uniref:Protein FAM162A n=1 Tax=Thamnophis sirtalis TaxID=35019 RepID=A0A6I9XTZ8_9SAUR|nr:PREDICTED: protein FAM162A [Thamnophis sirtalis]XP_032070399.1 protein FAM162A [Thamnophis elegans]